MGIDPVRDHEGVSAMILPWKCRTFYQLVMTEERNYYHGKIRVGPGILLPKFIKHGGDRCDFKPELSFTLKGVHPFKKDTFWSPLWNTFDRRVKHILFYRAPGQEPKDRATMVGIETALNPRLNRTLRKSKLYDDYLRRLQYNTGISPTMLLIVILGLSAFLGVLYFGGYFD